MSDWYVRQFGDRSKFAITIAFGETTHGQSPLGWGGLALWVKDRCLTRAVDAEGVITDSIRWELVDFLQWLRQSSTRLLNEEPLPALAANVDALGDLRPRDACDWFDLTEEPPTTLSESEEDDWFLARSEWRRHHALRRAMDGVALPNVYFRRLGDTVEVSWDNDTWATPRPQLRFVEQRGTELVSARAFSKAIHQCLQDAASVLKERHPEHIASLAPLARPCEVEPSDWRWLVHASTAEVIRERLPLLNRKLEAHARHQHDGSYLLHCEETLVLRHARLTTPEDIQALLGAAATATASRPMSDTLRKLVKRSSPPATRPWEEGYRRALEVREALGWGNAPIPSLETWLAEQQVAVHSKRLPGEVASLSLVTPDDRAGITVNPASTSRQRLEVAHGAALGHILLDEDMVAVEGSWEHWPSAARARAFSVMLQLPDAGVRSLLPGRVVRDVGDVRRVMKHFKAGPIATVHHLRNRRFIPSDELRDEIGRELFASRLG